MFSGAGDACIADQSSQGPGSKERCEAGSGGRQLRLETIPPARPKPRACDESEKQVRGWQKLHERV